MTMSSTFSGSAKWWCAMVHLRLKHPRRPTVDDGDAVACRHPCRPALDDRDFPLEIGDVFACISTTIGPMDKQMGQADSAHQIGLKPALYPFLILVESDDGGG
jgi:hypothetical protein